MYLFPLLQELWRIVAEQLTWQRHEKIEDFVKNGFSSREKHLPGGTVFSQSIAVQICFTSVGFGLGAWDIVSLMFLLQNCLILVFSVCAGCQTVAGTQWLVLWGWWLRFWSLTRSYFNLSVWLICRCHAFSFSSSEHGQYSWSHPSSTLFMFMTICERVFWARSICLSWTLL